MAVPIKDFSLFLSLFKSLERGFVTSSERRYKYTWDSYPVKLQSRSPEKIVEILEPGRYRVLIKNLSNQTIPLYLGDADPEFLASQVSAWQVDPLGIRIDITECTIWALPPADCDIIVTIQSEELNPRKAESDMPDPLIVFLDAPTGKDFYLPEEHSYGWKKYHGGRYLTERGDSQLGIDGFKTFSLAGFQSGSPYEFSVKIDSSFTSINSDSNECIQVHSLTCNIIDKLTLFMFAGFMDDYLGTLPDSIPLGLKTWIAGGKIDESKLRFRNLALKDENRKLIPTDKLIIKPNLLSRYYFFRVKLDINEWRSAVFDYDHVNQTVNILGY